MAHKSETSQSKAKRKRGRPRKDPSQKFEPFGRVLIVLQSFDEARRSGMKYEAALREAARAAACSVAEVRRIRARYQSKNAEAGLVFGAPRRLSQAEKDWNKALGLPRVFWDEPTVTPFFIGPLPTYSRHNAKKRAEKS